MAVPMWGVAVGLFDGQSVNDPADDHCDGFYSESNVGDAVSAIRCG